MDLCAGDWNQHNVLQSPLPPQRAIPNPFKVSIKDGFKACFVEICWLEDKHQSLEYVTL